MKPDAVNSTTNYLDRIIAKRPPPLVPIEEAFVLDEESKRNIVRIPETFESVELLMMTDLQYGHKEFKAKRFREFSDWILSEGNRFVFLGGDLIDAAIPLSVQNPYENVCEPSEQVTQLVEQYLIPLRPRILGYVGGNHERRTAKGFGKAGRLIATLAGIPYSRGMQYIDIHFGKHDPFKVTLWHGIGNARTKGAKAQMLHRFMSQGDSQCYLCGHLHDVVVLYDWRMIRSRDGKIALVKTGGAMSSSFLGYWNSFAEEAGLPPTDTMMARIQLDKGGGWQLTLR